MASHIDFSHHIRALPPAIGVMGALGFSVQQCLQGTGIDEQQLSATDSPTDFTLEQEFRFHRNLLRLTGDPLLGLRVGRAYTLQSYGLLGYAFLSAPTLRQALMVIRKYGPLAFSLFRLDFEVRGREGVMFFSHQVDVPPDLITYYVDRDLAAVLFGGAAEMPQPLTPLGVACMHGNKGRRRDYEREFNCPVEFNAPRSELRFDVEALDAPMPLRDAQTSGMLQQQCDLLLARMSKGSGFIDRVRQLIIARPGYFPDIDYVAEKLGMSSRNLRRKLSAEGSSYQRILDELRHELAREYLATSSLPLEEISILLGYSTPGNFSHAFKRWHGTSPSQFRQESH
jgi:AraC-like DNA-binding protein